MGAQAKQYYADIKYHIKARKGTTIWSVERCLHALYLWDLEEHRYPFELDLRSANGLPGYWVIKARFKSLEGYFEAYRTHLAVYGAPGRDLPDAALQASPGAQERPRSVLASSTTIRRACLQCGNPWESPNRRTRWVCERCTYNRVQNTDENGDGSWMTGEVVKETADIDWGDMEPVPLKPEGLAWIFVKERNSKRRRHDRRE